MDDSPTKGRQAGAEIKVTPEMAKAGEEALIALTISDLAAGDITPQEASVHVYGAMERARLQVPE